MLSVFIVKTSECKTEIQRKTLNATLKDCTRRMNGLVRMAIAISHLMVDPGRGGVLAHFH